MKAIWTEFREFFEAVGEDMLRTMRAWSPRLRAHPLAFPLQMCPTSELCAKGDITRQSSSPERAIWSGIGRQPANRRPLVPGLRDFWPGWSEFAAPPQSPSSCRSAERAKHAAVRFTISNATTRAGTSRCTLERVATDERAIRACTRIGSARASATDEC